MGKKIFMPNPNKTSPEQEVNILSQKFQSNFYTSDFNVPVVYGDT